MVELYLKKIKQDGWTIDQVPKLWKARVQAELDKEFPTA